MNAGQGVPRPLANKKSLASGKASPAGSCIQSPGSLPAISLWSQKYSGIQEVRPTLQTAFFKMTFASSSPTCPARQSRSLQCDFRVCSTPAMRRCRVRLHRTCFSRRGRIARPRPLDGGCQGRQKKTYPFPFGRFLSHIIAGHHAGLSDREKLDRRLGADYRIASYDGCEQSIPTLPTPCGSVSGTNQGSPGRF
jgi:hypothetical protein